MSAPYPAVKDTLWDLLANVESDTCYQAFVEQVRRALVGTLPAVATSTSVVVAAVGAGIARVDSVESWAAALSAATAHAAPTHRQTDGEEDMKGEEKGEGPSSLFDPLFVMVFTLVESYAVLKGSPPGADSDSPGDAHVATALKKTFMAVSEAILSLHFVLTGDAADSSRLACASCPADGNGEAVAESVRAAVSRLYFEWVLVCMQGVSARGASAAEMKVWTALRIECLEELGGGKGRADVVTAAADFSENEDDNEEGEEGEGGSGKKVSPIGAVPFILTEQLPQTVALEAARAWVAIPESFTATLLPRTRFRRAALLFKSFTPHMASQAPATTFLLADTLSTFAQEWRELCGRLPVESASSAFVRALEARYEEGSRGCASDKADELTDLERELLQLPRAYGKKLYRILSESNAHGYLLATVIGAWLGAHYVLPSSRNRSSTSTSSVVASMAMSSASSSSPSTATTTPASVSQLSRRPTAAAIQQQRRLQQQQQQHSESVGEPMAARDVMDVFESSSWLQQRPLSGPYTPEWLWRLKNFPPVGLLLSAVPSSTAELNEDDESNSSSNSNVSGMLRVFLQPHLFYFCTELRVGLSPAHQCEGRQKFAVVALLTRVMTVETALQAYHAAVILVPSLASPAAAAAAAAGSATRPKYAQAALERFTKEMEAFARGAESQLVIDTSLALHSNKNGASVAGSTAAAAAAADGVGSIGGERFCEMKFKHPLPAWTAYLQESGVPTATTTASPSCVTACALVLDLLAPRYHQLALDVMEHLYEPPARAKETEAAKPRGRGRAPAAAQRANVFIVPRRALPGGVNVQYYVHRMLEKRFSIWNREDSRRAQAVAEKADEDADARTRNERLCVLQELLPLLVTAQTYIASQSTLVSLLARLQHLLSSLAPSATPQPDAKAARRLLLLTELYLVEFVFPCLRVLPPSPPAMDMLHCLFDTMESVAAPSTQYGGSGGLYSFLHIKVWLRHLRPQHSMLPVCRYVKGGTRSKKDELVSEDAEEDNLAIRLVSGARRYPHDVVTATERESLFVQCLKRVNIVSVGHYRQIIYPVLCGDIFFCTEKFFSHCIGFSNNFLDIHVRFLRGLPPPLLCLFYAHGLAVLGHFAHTRGVEQVHLISSLLAAVWRDNIPLIDVGTAHTSSPGSVNINAATRYGAQLLRAVEWHLRQSTRSSLIIGTELLKAVLHQLLHRNLAHEEKMSPQQSRALAAPAVTKWFSRGAMESFRQTRWSDEVRLTLRSLHTARAVLQTVLCERMSVPVSDGSDDEEEDETEESPRRSHAGSRKVRSLTLGQHLLLHLCRLRSAIYELQSDMDGTMDEILFITGTDFNTLNDLVFAVEELLVAPAGASPLPSSASSSTDGGVSVGPPEELITQVASPALALRLCARFRTRSPGGDATLAPPPTVLDDNSPAAAAWGWYYATNDFISPSLLWQISYFAAGHFAFRDEPYELALAELQACRDKVKSLIEARHTTTTTVNSAAHRGGGGRRRGGARNHRQETNFTEEVVRVDAEKVSQEFKSSAEVRLLETMERRIQEERKQHEQVVRDSQAARENLKRIIVDQVLRSPSLGYSNGTRGGSAGGEDLVSVFAFRYLLPRALLSAEESLFVVEFLRWLTQTLREDYISANASGSSSSHGEESVMLYRRSLDMALCVITSVTTVFTGLTDAECSRVGYLIHELNVLLCAESAIEAGAPATRNTEKDGEDVLTMRCRLPALPPPLLAALEDFRRRKEAEENRGEAPGNEGSKGDSAAGASANKGSGGGSGDAKGSAGTYKMTTQMFELSFFEKGRPEAYRSVFEPSATAAATAIKSKAPAKPEAAKSAPAAPTEAKSSAITLHKVALSALPLQLEAFLCAFFAQYLEKKDDDVVPNFLKRNALLCLGAVADTKAQGNDTNASTTRDNNNNNSGGGDGGGERKPDSSSSTTRATPADSYPMDSVYFPRTQAAAGFLLRLVAPLAVNANRESNSNSTSSSNNPNHALANSIYRTLPPLIKKRLAFLTLLTGYIEASSEADGGGGDSDVAKSWFALWRQREKYAEGLLRSYRRGGGAGGGAGGGEGKNDDNHEEEMEMLLRQQEEVEEAERVKKEEEDRKNKAAAEAKAAAAAAAARNNLEDDDDDEEEEGEGEEESISDESESDASSSSSSSTSGNEEGDDGDEEGNRNTTIGTKRAHDDNADSDAGKRRRVEGHF